MAAESNLRKQEYLKKGVIRLNPNALPQLHLDFGLNKISFNIWLKIICPIVRFMAKLSKTKMGNIIQLANIELAVCFVCFGCHLEKYPNRFERMNETHPKLHDYCINKLGCGRVLDFIGVKY